MTFSLSPNLTGGLFAWRHGMSGLPTSQLLTATQLTHRPSDTNPRWHHLTLQSDKGLLSEADAPTGGFTYDFILRESEERDERFLLLGQDEMLVEVLLARLAPPEERQAPEVGVGSLVTHLVTQQDHYRMTGVFARTDTEGQALRSMSFYGNDLAASILFTEFLARSRPYRVQLRAMRSWHDTLSIATNGALSLLFKDEPATIRDIDAALRFLKPWIRWPASIAPS